MKLTVKMFGPKFRKTSFVPEVPKKRRQFHGNWPTQIVYEISIIFSNLEKRFTPFSRMKFDLDIFFRYESSIFFARLKDFQKTYRIKLSKLVSDCLAYIYLFFQFRTFRMFYFC